MTRDPRFNTSRRRRRRWFLTQPSGVTPVANTGLFGASLFGKSLFGKSLFGP